MVLVLSSFKLVRVLDFDVNIVKNIGLILTPFRCTVQIWCEPWNDTFLKLIEKKIELTPGPVLWKQFGRKMSQQFNNEENTVRFSTITNLSVPPNIIPGSE